MILATHGFLASSIGQFDADAQAFFNRVTTAGGTLSATEQNAINTLVKQMKTDGIWTKMKAIYPMVGASAAACAQNLKSSSFTGTFTSGWTFASTGVTPNGTSAYMNTGLNVLSQTTLNSFSMSFYSRTDSVNVGATEIGATNDRTDFLPLVTLEIKRTANSILNQFAACIYSYQSGQISQTSNLNSQGFYQASRTSSTSFKTYKNNLNVSNITSTQNQAINVNSNVFIGAMNAITAAENFSDRQCAFASIGDGLTDTEASNFYTAVQAFQTTLSRQV
jgi:hypothetical protein